MRKIVEKQHNRLFFVQNRRLKTGRFFERENSERPAVPQERDLEDRAKNCFSGNLFVCQDYETQGCRFGERCVFMHGEVDSQPNGFDFVEDLYWILRWLCSPQSGAWDVYVIPRCFTVFVLDMTVVVRCDH